MPEVAKFQALCVWSVLDVSKWVTKGNISLSIYQNTEENTFRLIGVDESQAFVINEYFSKDLPQKHNELFVSVLVGSGLTFGLNFMNPEDAEKFVSTATAIINKSTTQSASSFISNEREAVSLTAQTQPQLMQAEAVSSQASSGSYDTITFQEEMERFAERMREYIEQKTTELENQIMQLIAVQRAS
ncbi:uncharacterized protein MONOS_5409 [Monocercomonoides exilis]|uniref:uncharacterized protein n=1 Tax=Monocercomonoides exilis TaxID=2049356 RepID=UPI00355A6C4C|nr:hypothetical protein MONOS_5409 [Monocercomonoides exilis]|eukprot:MONOS_5409.1-p1 / transcript=MONOS_5409.1 / gene=MONOS_5409 / organism=Monocercomonoides_exilis_PA203 / gene_product=unspecified product / transcript_product=unspecified product / location=Mono_scaffold00157:830-1500(-) / protein_length=186 / sequence_SO=supercontig / SO=protein_coding / is_pseudo=false